MRSEDEIKDKEIAELKAENEKLKALCDTYRTCYQAKHSDIKGLLFKYKQTLQDIKGYLSTLSGVDNDFVNTETYLRILDLITKAESEE